MAQVYESLRQPHEESLERCRIIHQVVEPLGVLGETQQVEDHVTGLGGTEVSVVGQQVDEWPVRFGVPGHLPLVQHPDGTEVARRYSIGCVVFKD